MSAMTGIWLLRAIAGRASASSWLGQATRTMSQPEAVSSAICWSVALMSVVGVVVIDCTETGKSLPTPTLPTWIWRVWRRGARTGGGRGGIPRETLIPPLCPASAEELDRLDDVGVDEQHRHGDEHEAHAVGDGQALGDVDEAGVGTVTQACPALLDRLPDRPRHVPAVEREQRHEVEDEEGEVERSDEQDQLGELDPVAALVGRYVERGDLAADPADTDDGDGAVGVACLGPEGGLHDARHLLGDLDDDRCRVDEAVPDELGRLGDRGPDELLTGREPGEAHRRQDEPAVLGDRVALVVVGGALDDGGRDRDRHLLVAALDDPRHRLALAVADRGGDLVPRGHGAAVDGDDAVALLQARSLCRRDGVARLAMRLR